MIKGGGDFDDHGGGFFGGHNEKNYFVQSGYPKRVFFQLDRFVVARFYRWAKRLSQRGSKYLTLDTLNKLRKAGLELFTAKPLRPVKGAR